VPQQPANPRGPVGKGRASASLQFPPTPPRQQQRRSRFKDHLSAEEIEQGLKDGTLLSGVLRVNHKLTRLAYVTVEGFDKDIIIDGIVDRNRAFEGDTVIIRLNDPSKWQVEKETKTKAAEHEADAEEEEEEEEEEEIDVEELTKLEQLTLDDSPIDAMVDTDDDEVSEEDGVFPEESDSQLSDKTSEEESVGAVGEEEEEVVVMMKVKEEGEEQDTEELDDEEIVLLVGRKKEISRPALPMPGPPDALPNLTRRRGWWPTSGAPEMTVEILPEEEEKLMTVSALSNQPSTPKKGLRCQEVGHISRECTNPRSDSDESHQKKSSSHTETNKSVGKEDQGAEEKKLRRTAKIVAIAKANHVEEMLGYLKPCNEADETVGGTPLAFFVPFEKRMPRMLVPVHRIPTSLINHPSELTTNIFLCKLVDWPNSSAYPKGKLIKNMGHAGVMEVELHILLKESDIDWEDSFAPDVLACLPIIPPSTHWQISEEEILVRRDLRKERIFTIDPATAKDMDDAVSCKLLPDGTYLVGVHIADVTYFVKPNTPLDEEAKKRATTVYMVHRSIPMLPRLLSDDMCSLVPGEDRLAFSVMWRMERTGKVLEEPWFGRTIIRSCAKMSYEAAQEMLDGCFVPQTSSSPLQSADGKPPRSIFIKDPTAPQHCVEDLIEDVIVLNDMAEALRNSRLEDGSLTLDDAKMFFCLDQSGMPTGVGTYTRTASHLLIEEFMLLANKSVAKRIHSAFPDRALLRHHPPPNPNRLNEFNTICNTHSVAFDTGSSKGFQRSLKSLALLPNPDMSRVITRFAVKPMSMAKYICTDEGAEEGAYRHYALAFDHYTHFTSPIRRYADVIVHRLLEACLKSTPVPLDKEDLCTICGDCNMRKRKADKAQDKCDLVFLCKLLETLPPKDVDAIVCSVHNFSFEAYIPTYGVEKMVRVEDIPLAKYEYAKNDQALYLHWPAAVDASDKTPISSESSAQQRSHRNSSRKAIVQEIKPFQRLRVRLYPDLKKRPIDVRLVVTAPEGAAIPKGYYDMPAPVEPVVYPTSSPHLQGQKPDNYGTPAKGKNASKREDAKRKQIMRTIQLFVEDTTQQELLLPGQLSSNERLLAHEIAESHGLSHQADNYFCLQTNTTQRRLKLVKQNSNKGVQQAFPASFPPTGTAFFPAPATATTPVMGTTPTRPKVKKRNQAAKLAVRTRASDAVSRHLPDTDALHCDAGGSTTPKKIPVQEAKQDVAVLKNQGTIGPTKKVKWLKRATPKDQTGK